MITTKQFINILKKDKGKIYSLEKLMKLYSLGDPIVFNSLRTNQYDHFYNVMQECIAKGILIEKKSAKYNTNPFKPLKLKYDKQVEEKIEVSDEDKVFLHLLNPKIDTTYYLKRPKELSEDKQLLILVNNFLNDSKDKAYISIKERSYQLFKDEKLIQTTNFLSRIKLNYDDLKVLENPQPLLCFMNESFYKKRKKNILVVENLDTFWSFQRYIFGDKKIKDIDMVIYGSGYNITNTNYDFSYYNITTDDNIYYFGDLDSEGIKIYQLFKNKFPDYKIKIATCFYKYLISKLSVDTPRELLNQNTADISMLEEEAYYVEEDVLKCFKRVIEEKLFIPQEALNLDVLRRNENSWKI